METLRIILAVFLLAACSSAPMPQQRPPQAAAKNTYFDAALANRLDVGKSTRKDVLAVMGQPYSDDPKKETGRLVYMHTQMTQVVFEFDGDVLKAKTWGDIFGVHREK